MPMELTLIIAPDIYGLTPAVEELAGQLAADQVIPLDPYDGKSGWFTDQAKAYAHFTRHVGLAAYARSIYNLLMDRPPDQRQGARVLLGFSVGASALWTLSDNHEFSDIRLCLGYYGSQIRNHTGIHPHWPMELIFPESEDHFDVNALVATLAGRDNLSLKTEPGRHGFMNPYAPDYDPELARAQVTDINHRLDQIRHM